MILIIFDLFLLRFSLTHFSREERLHQFVFLHFFELKART